MRGWGAYIGEEEDGTLMSLGKLLDESEGWLHDGSLRVVCKLTVVTGIKRVESNSVGTGSQQGLRDDFRALLESERLADVTIKVEDGQIMAHTQVLAARSPVFC